MSERQSKTVQGRHERILNELTKKPGNETCADCGAKNPRWASYSLGIFLCIRCAGIHRKMGTHISKVKSITMDQWTTEQIELMRNSGGNVIVNNKINPNPGNHPRPLATDDEHAMEKYIRAKWEKRSFMSVSSPPVMSSTAKLTVPPKRSSSVPTFSGSSSSHTNNLTTALNQLSSMGFKNEGKNKQVLIQTQGNLKSAVEILSKSTDESKVEQLIKLGFNDKSNNMEALRRAGGNIDIAMTILSEKKTFAGQSSSSLLINVDSTPVTTTTASNPFITTHTQVHPQPFVQQNTTLFNNNPFGNALSTSTSSPTSLFPPNPQLTSASFNPFSQMVTMANYNNSSHYLQPTAPPIQQQTIQQMSGIFSSPQQQSSIFQQPQQQQPQNQQQQFWSTNSLF
ncbi:uncharacterized protein BX663DRAFT_491285 [Cokeromyces recurvatus]|uniref:uncharacterized protein n=1 Tax=Cokeromyces recurvatus TaxID=90255 RepID=UPI002220FA1A|nr:uncharacterized protein BX663DRAFT_491285 [Cokeromyces recurvatus]KAI7907557.1 hypothetical protein BX663DRAFT_491285 [Cokeromyces recurvatus]